MQNLQILFCCGLVVRGRTTEVESKKLAQLVKLVVNYGDLKWWPMTLEVMINVLATVGK